VLSPEYVDAIRRLGDDRKANAFATSVLMSDGISPSTIDTIYRRLYLGGGGTDARAPSRSAVFTFGR
jgi:lysine/ornithine N-monooxygenase